MNRVRRVLSQYVDEVIKIYGSHLRKIVLYGSYARGDETRDSDIDILILVNLDDQAIKKYSDVLSDLTFDINMDNDVMIMPIVKNEAHFNYWVEVYPFYGNIRKEGVALYGAA